MGKDLTRIKESAKFNADFEITKQEQVNDALNHIKDSTNHENAKVGYLADENATKLIKESTKTLFDHTKNYRIAVKDLLNNQAELIENAKILTQKSKDYSNQVGEAMARIDKVLVKDFESKLVLLERFVVASKEVIELDKQGFFNKISQSFNK